MSAVGGYGEVWRPAPSADTIVRGSVHTRPRFVQCAASIGVAVPTLVCGKVVAVTVIAN